MKFIDKRAAYALLRMDEAIKRMNGARMEEGEWESARKWAGAWGDVLRTPAPCTRARQCDWRTAGCPQRHRRSEMGKL